MSASGEGRPGDGGSRDATPPGSTHLGRFCTQERTGCGVGVLERVGVGVGVGLDGAGTGDSDLDGRGELGTDDRGDPREGVAADAGPEETVCRPFSPETGEAGSGPEDGCTCGWAQSCCANVLSMKRRNIATCSSRVLRADGVSLGGGGKLSTNVHSCLVAARAWLPARQFTSA